MARTARRRLAANAAPMASRVTLDHAAMITVTDEAATAGPTLGLAHDLVTRLAAHLGIEPARVMHLTPGEERVLCGRCQGTGHLPEYAHNGGECYTCGGDPVVDMRTAYSVTYALDLDEAVAYRAHGDKLAAGDADDFLAAFFDIDTRFPTYAEATALVY